MPRSEETGRGVATRTPAPRPATHDAWSVIERAQAGDPDAFAELYTRYQDVVFRFIYFRIGHRQTAEDLAQDTFVRALGSISRWQWQGKDPVAMFITIARNLVFDYRKSGRSRLEMNVPDMFDMDRTDLAATPESAAITSLTAGPVLAVMRQLPGDQARVLILRHWCDLTVDETAARMGLSVGATKALTFRAVRSLRRLIPREAVEAAA